MGLAAQVRMDRASAIDNRQAAYRDAKTQLARIEAEQAKIPRKRSAAEIKGEIEAKLAAAITITAKVTRTLAAVTEQCARPTRGTSEACAVVWQLRQELTAAHEWERLDGEAQAVRARIEALRMSGAGELATADAQADFLARALGLMLGRGVDVAGMRLAVVVLLGIVLEVGSSCGLYVALGSHELPEASRLRGGERMSEREETLVEIADYCAARLKAERGARLTMSQARADYERWCAKRGSEPLPREIFLRQFRAEAAGKGWSIAGGVVHHAAVRADVA
jgi:hypothetical protein